MRCSRRAQKFALIAALVAAALAPGCGGDGDEPESTSPLEDPGAVEAAPEAPPATTPAASEPGDLPADDEAEVTAAVDAYIAALNSGDGAAVCAAIVPEGIRLGELPRRKGSCPASVSASIGFRGPGGTPAWRRTKVAEVTAVSVGEGTARVTATVTHDFADRKYNSIEEDVIYLGRHGDAWLIAKPSGTFYRAIGYPEPPLRALTPP
jgi:hypothetical protein